MEITYIFRCPGTGYSLEKVFHEVRSHICREGSVHSELITLPYISQGLRSVWLNLAFLKNKDVGIAHITGDVHYAVFSTNPRTTVLTIADCVLLNRTPKYSLRYFVFWLFWYYLPMQRATCVTAISEKTRKELSRYVGSSAEKVKTIPCHYDPGFIYCEKCFNTEKPIILHVGTAPHKNISRLIEAAAGLSCQLVIVGKLSELDTQTLSKYNIDYQNYVNISQQEIISLYERCDIVSFVSLYEGFGLPVLEAQVVGRPVVTSNISPMTEVGGEGACYVSPTDVADIRRGILQVWHDETYRHKLIQEGRRNAEKYSIERITAQYVALYESLHDALPHRL